MTCKANTTGREELVTDREELVNFCVLFQFVMPPTSKKLRGHIGLGLSVQSVSQSVCLSVSLSVCDA